MRKLALLAAALVVTAPLSSARADPASFLTIDPYPLAEYDGVYMTLGAGALVRQVPNFNTPYSVGGSTTPIFSTDPSVVNGGGGLTVGFRAPWLGFGSRPRVELGVGGWGGSASKKGGEGVPPLMSIFSIDGTAALFCGGCDGATTVDVDYFEIGSVVRVKSDFPFAPQWTVTPSVGFVGSYAQTRYQSDTPFALSATSLLLPASVKETLKTVRLGGEVGVNVGFRATQQLSFSAGAGVQLLWTRTDLDGNDCASGAQPAGLPCSGAAFATTVSSTDTQFAYRVLMSLTATYDVGWMKISLTGFGSWDSDMPGVRNPTTAALAPTGVPASIVYESRWAYGGALMATFPLFLP